MGFSDLIENFIKQELEKAGYVQINRGEVSRKFNVVPSQINYVLTSRFTPEQGYIIESRRGGGGYILIKKADHGGNMYMHIINSIGSELSFNDGHIFLKNMLENDLLTQEQYKIMRSVVMSKTINSLLDGDKIRADLFKNMLISIIT